MGDISKLEPVRTKTNQDAARLLRELACDADAGEVVAITVIAELKGGKYRLCGSHTLSRREMMGALMEALLWRSQDGA